MRTHNIVEIGGEGFVGGAKNVSGGTLIFYLHIFEVLSPRANPHLIERRRYWVSIRDRHTSFRTETHWKNIIISVGYDCTTV